MSKTETLRQLSTAATEQRLSRIAAQIETVRQAKLQSAEELAAALEPLAQAMATLTDETRQTLSGIDGTSRAEAQALQTATQKAQAAVAALIAASQGLEWRHFLMAVLIGLSTAVLVSGLWLWLAPPTIETRLNAQAVAEFLQPALIEAVQPCAGTPPG